MRNSHGNDVVALEELPLKRWLDQGDDNWDGYITDQLHIGGDLRVQGIQYNKTEFDGIGTAARRGTLLLNGTEDYHNYTTKLDT